MPLSDASRHFTEHIKHFFVTRRADVEVFVCFKVIFKLANHHQTQIKLFSQTVINNNRNQLHFLKTLTR